MQAILDIQRPKTKRDLKSFLGVVSFYRIYHEGLPKKVTPLLQLLKKNARFVWTEDCESAFQEIREGLKNIKALSFPDEEEGAGRYIIQTDASQYAIGGTFSQMSRDGKEERLIACFGRALRSNERNWQVGEREGLALMVALLKYKHLILGNPGLEIRSDNLSVKFLQKIKTSNSPRLSRWSIAMSDILARAQWTHIPGKDNAWQTL